MNADEKLGPIAGNTIDKCYVRKCILLLNYLSK
jgi:hypothetical protein